ncbi:MAG: aspartate kinase, partial [Theionarchaea archaeon]|nr:aspartate kinase [Theionarchaea archaeon]
MRLVMKFGGGLLVSQKGYSDCAKLVRDITAEGHEVVVVVSAMGGVTDQLVDAMDSLDGGTSQGIGTLCGSLRSLHQATAGGAGAADRIGEKIDDLIGILERALEKYAGGDGTAQRSDEISSMGERLSAPIFAHYLEELGVPTDSLTGGEAGIVTDSNFGNASPDMETCRELVGTRLGSLLDRGKTPVVTGFMAENAEGEITTMGRGGSDYTTSIIGACLGVDEIWIWKDVCGIMTANPKVVPEAKTIPLLSYSEAAELAHFGASVLHPRTMEPAMRSMIPIRVKDATRPDLEGTLIGGDSLEV